ncbi:MAG: glycosyltransferase [Deltaproteobacteria bacterium]|nr:glycosyltransferase [Deltaproteobacteria bacterium]MBI3296385.1 glycosyltransferase [Deltaproteobacteria bacterium]
MSATVVVPAYNEGRRLPPFLSALCAAIGPTPLAVLVVDDGSRPEELARVGEALNQITQRYPQISLSLIRQPLNRGKGAALALGFHKAKTPIIGFVDADGSIGADEVVRLYEELNSHTREAEPVAAVLGSRVRLLGRDVERSPLRHIIGRVFATLFSFLFDIPIYDSQCGCKFFLRSEVMPLLPLIQNQRWLWDTELLVLLYRSGRRILELPISWVDKAGSKVSLFRDPFQMFWGLLGLKSRLDDTNIPTPASRRPLRKSA